MVIGEVYGLLWNEGLSMGYEIDFIGIDEENVKSADAIAMRWEKENGSFVVGVYDGGTNEYGEALVDLLNQYYFNENEEKVVDFVICSHSDMDHASGLKNIIENFTVKTLYMNRPWLYTEELLDLRADGRITGKSLEERLKQKYPYISALEELANQNKVNIKPAFQKEIIMDDLIILSPSKEFYLKCLVESDKTPLKKQAEATFTKSIFESVKDKLCDVLELWDIETLHEDTATSPENESSVILFGRMQSEDFLLTGDAGILALNEAARFSEGKIDLTKCGFYQIPHHGSKHNVCPYVLDIIVGNRQPRSLKPNKTAFVSSAKGSSYPRRIVVNAFIRRGCKVYSTNGKNIWHHYNMLDRKGYSELRELSFYNYVESYRND